MAGVISEQTEAEYESELSRIKDESGVLVRLVTVSSMMEASNESAWASSCWDSEYFSEDNGFMRQMFRHFGMEGGDQPSMLIALSTEDRQFKFVMPGLSERPSGSRRSLRGWVIQAQRSCGRVRER